jgi:hypothetical protein
MQVLTLCLLSAGVSAFTAFIVPRLLREPPRPSGLGGLWKRPQPPCGKPAEKLNFINLKLGDREKLIRNGWMNEDGTPAEKFLRGRGPRG